jgi:hypothetical protein
MIETDVTHGQIVEACEEVGLWAQTFQLGAGATRKGWEWRGANSDHFVYAVFSGPIIVLTGVYSQGKKVEDPDTDGSVLISLLQDAANIECYGPSIRAQWCEDTGSDADTYDLICQNTYTLAEAVLSAEDGGVGKWERLLDLVRNY